ncbi:hypothetical protein [Niveibacterium terrae]|uniref:hypothetical protein n=1 Tax=Niveibacterium terrae TaxID=3373598 RepID=UPI003A936A5E
MGTQHWIVNWTHRDGKNGRTAIEWPGEPSRETAAARIREALLGKDYLLVNTPRGHSEPTVFLMEHYGYIIGAIDPIEE